MMRVLGEERNRLTVALSSGLLSVMLGIVLVGSLVTVRAEQG